MADLNLLFVDDETNQLDIITDIVKELDAGEVIYSNSFDSAISMNQSRRLDGAIIDLRLSDKKNRTGKDLAEFFITKAGVPCVILSGNPEDISNEFEGYDNFKICNKLKGEYQPAVQWFLDQGPMLGALREMRDGLTLKGASLFSRNLWPRWSTYLAETKEDPGKLGQMILRQCAGYIAEEMSVNEAPGWHSFEAYFKPSLRQDRAHTGDIFELEDGLWIILSPQCDMANKKIATVILAACANDAVQDWTSARDNYASVDDGKKKKGADAIRGFIGQNKLKPSNHFLPPFGANHHPLIVDFGNVKIVAMNDVDAILKQRIASLSPALIPNLTQRFGAWISRTGQPDFDPGHV